VAGIDLLNLTKVYANGVRAVDAIDLEIRDGEFMVLVGPSGCGKSTLLRMIAGLEEVSEGTVRIDDRDVTALAPRARDIAMVFQDYALYPHMTVRQNLAFGLKLRRVNRREIEQRVQAVATTLGLQDYLARRPAALSGGQRQRVAIGRAMVREPKAFLMDEPLSNLDAKLRVTMRAELARLHERLAVTTVYVTHDQTEAMTLGQRVAVIRDGTVQQCDTPQELFDRPNNLFVAAFIGSPAMNLVAGRLDAHSVAIGDLSLAPGGAAGEPGRPVTIGLRPEHLDLAADGPIPLKTELLERLGADTIVHGRLADGTRLVARAAGTLALRLGDTVRLSIAPEHIHLFDAESGRRL
jgi:multiple sugar transport system ATP-binding protein